jgi:hypothetical protein
MFEDMLTYQFATFLNQPFGELLAANLDDDARQFYARMAADIAFVAISANRPAQAPTITQKLLEALVASPAAREACWRQLYRKISGLVAGCDPETVAEVRRAEHIRALGRLRQFLSENDDIVDALAFEDVKRTVLGQVAGA